MKIERVIIQGFGQLGNQELELSPTLNLVFGQNEAGKSTLWAFVRAVLFGFESARSKLPRYEPPSGAFGGSLLVSAGPEVWKVTRLGSRSVAGELSLKTTGGEYLPPDRLGTLLGGISKELFCQVFSINLDALTDFEQLAKESSVSDALFAAGIPGARRLPEVRALLEKSTSERYSPRARNKPLNELFDRLETLQARLREVGDRPGEYFEALARFEALSAELAERSRAAEGKRAEVARLRRLVEVAPRLLEALELAPRLAADAALASFPLEALARVEEWVKRRGALRDEVRAQERAAAGHAEAIERLSRARLDPAAVAALVRALAAYEDRRSEALALPAAAAELAGERTRLQARLSGLGQGLDEAGLRALEVGAGARAALLGIRSAQAEAQASVRTAEEGERAVAGEHDRTQGELHRLEASLAGLTEQRPDLLSRRLSALDDLRDGRTELVRRTEELERAIEAQEQLSGPDELPPRHPFPLALCLAVALPLVALAIAGAVWVSGPLRWVAAGGVGIAAVILLAQRRAERAHRDAVVQCGARNDRRLGDRERARAQLEAARRAIEALRRKNDLAARAAMIDPEADAAALAERRSQLEELRRQAQLRLQREEDLRAAQLQLGTQAERLASAQRRTEAARAELERAALSLRTFLGSRGLPADLSADQAIAIWTEAAAIQEELFKLEARAHGLEATRGEANERAQALLGALRGCGQSADGAEEARGAARALLERRGKEEQELEGARRAAEAAALRLDGLRAQLAELDAQLEAVLRRAGASEVAELFSLGERARAHQLQQARLAELTLAVELSAGGSLEDAAAALEAAGGAGAARDTLEALGRTLAEESEELERRRNERAELQAQLKAWEHDGELRQLRSEEEALKLRLEAQVRRYAVERFALCLVDRVKDEYEARHQPTLLQAVQKAFKRLTGGRYERVFFQDDKGRKAVAVQDLEGRRLGAEQLSRGTREQLFLAFRLALAQELATSKVALPLMLDDLLVNFDPERTRLAIEALAELAFEQQVIAFSCHPHVRKLFLEAGAKLVELDRRQQELSLSLRTA